MVVYTPAAKSILERVVGSVEMAIDGAIAHTNQIFEDSGITTRLNLVHVAPVFYLEQPNVDFSADLNNLMGKTDGYMDEVHPLRDQHKADLVAMISGVWFASYAGIAPAPSPLDEAKGFSITEACNITDTTFTQQIGFNLGSTHDEANASALPPVQPYGYGYQDPKENAGDYGDFVTVMAKRTGGECPPIVTANQCSIIERFSNPNQTHNGKPIGSAEADNVRSINELAVIVANYRDSSGTSTPTSTPDGTSTPGATPTPTATDAPASAELVINGGFEIDADKDSIPDFWKGKGLVAGDGVVCTDAYAGKCALKLTGSQRSITQKLDSAGQTLNFSAYIAGEALTAGAQLRVVVKYTDDTSDKLTLDVPAGTYDYTLLSGSVEPDTTKTVKHIKVQARTKTASGSLTVDAVSVTTLLLPLPLPQ
jgi:hypothetical protein